MELKTDPFKIVSICVEDRSVVGRRCSIILSGTQALVHIPTVHRYRISGGPSPLLVRDISLYDLRS